jgi:3',5'-cyclic-nucleotide phosphodiesterase
VKCEDDLASLYNDRSPLENKHARITFEVSKMPGCEIFSGLSKEDYTTARKGMIEMIIQTDMEFHAAKMEKLDAASGFSTEDASDKLFWLEIVLHGLDIGNVAFKWNECYKFARMVGAEFKSQFAKEGQNGIGATQIVSHTACS